MIYVGCMPRHFTTIAGFDDAPFPADHEGAVKVVGTVYAGLKLNGVLIGEVEKDGHDAAETIERFAIEGSLPEPLRVAHLIAGAVAEGQSRGRA